LFLYILCNSIAKSFSLFGQRGEWCFFFFFGISVRNPLKEEEQEIYMSSWFYLEVVIGALLQLGFGYACVCCMLLWLVFNTAVSMSLRPKRYVGFVLFVVDALDLTLCWSLRFFLWLCFRLFCFAGHVMEL